MGFLAGCLGVSDHLDRVLDDRLHRLGREVIAQGHAIGGLVGTKAWARECRAAVVALFVHQISSTSIRSFGSARSMCCTMAATLSVAITSRRMRGQSRGPIRIK